MSRMLEIKEMCSSPEVLAKGLRYNAERHLKYKLYMPIDRAMAILLNGHIYLADGSTWNDTHDSAQMSINQYFGLCFSCSTTESIAMWMLYGGNGGKNGSMFNFPQKVVKNLARSENAIVGYFDGAGNFVTQQLLNRDFDYELFLTDVVYYEMCDGNNKCKISYFEQHITKDAAYIESSGIIRKHFAWSYEKESRLILRLSEEGSHKIGQINDNRPPDKRTRYVRITLSDHDRKLMFGNLYRSPVFSGSAVVGGASTLASSVNWNLT